MLKRFIFSVFMLFSIGILQAQTPMTDDEAIKTVIIGQTTAWANRDSVEYVASRIDDPITQSVYNNRDGSIGVFKGFEIIKTNIHESIKTKPTKTYEAKIERTDWLIKRLSEEWAWVNFYQKTPTLKGEIYTSYETRLMKKVDNKWKIAVINAVWDYKNVVNKQ